MLNKMLSFLAVGQRAPMKDVATPQVENSAGGYVWAVGPWTRLERFLILGSSASTFYATARALTIENADAVLECMDLDGLRLVKTLVNVVQSGRAPRPDATILALAMCLKAGDASTRKAACDAVPQICRTGTQLFQLAEAVDSMGGWGRVTRRAFARWYQRADVDGLAYQVSKYRQRGGWSHRDVLRKAHPIPPSPAHNALYAWVTQGKLDVGAPARLGLADAAANATSADQAIRYIKEYGLVREELPTSLLNNTRVWEALLMMGKGMPMNAMLRNLAKMTAVGLLTERSVATRHVVARLGDSSALRGAQVHPLHVLVAMNTYQRGQGIKGSLRWTPVRAIVEALDRAFDLSFAAAPVTGKRHLLAVDVSGSMSWSEIAGMTGITPRIGAAAMAAVTAQNEPNTVVTAFGHTLQPVDLSRTRGLPQILSVFQKIPMGGTDCALPMLYALENRIPIDTFVVYTDSETWFGKVHPAEALRRYRKEMGIDARLIVAGMVSNGFTIADPDDRGMMDVVGFDAAAPRIMADFTLGRLDG